MRSPGDENPEQPALRRTAVACSLALLAACAPEPAKPDVDAAVSSAAGQVLRPTTLYVTYLEPTNAVVVFDKIGGSELARGLAEPGGRLPVTIDGRACEVLTHGTSLETDYLQPSTDPEAPVRNTAPPRERKTREARVTLRCADGPVPGIEPTPAVEGWTVARSMLPALLLGLLAGFLFWRGDERDAFGLELLGFALLLAVLVTAAVLSWQTLRGGLVLTVPLLAGAVSGCGFFAVLLGARNKEARARVGAGGFVLAALVGPVALALAVPVWAAGAPLAACGVLLAVALVSAVVAVSG